MIPRGAAEDQGRFNTLFTLRVLSVSVANLFDGDIFLDTGNILP